MSRYAVPYIWPERHGISRRPRSRRRRSALRDRGVSALPRRSSERRGHISAARTTLEIRVAVEMDAGVSERFVAVLAVQGREGPFSGRFLQPDGRGTAEAVANTIFITHPFFGFAAILIVAERIGFCKPYGKEFLRIYPRSPAQDALRDNPLPPRLKNSTAG